MGKTSSVRVAVYSRVSTDNGRQKIGLQTSELKDYCERRNWSIHKSYSDKGISGSTDSRPALDAMMEDLRKGLFDIVVVWKIDRLGRSVTHLLSALNEFQNHSVGFVSVTENLDSTTPQGRMVFTMLGALAEFERSLIQERVRAGIKRARERGVQFGRPRIGFDYKKAIKMRKDGHSLRAIGEALGVSHMTVRRIVQ